jgi:hypothetical protein
MHTIITRFLQSPKRLLFSGSIALNLLAFAMLPTVALAATSTTPKCTAKDVSCVIQFGNQQISNRITALNKLDATITDDQNKHLIDDDHATSLHSDVQTNVTGLNTLKTTLDAETDAKTARQDVDKIYTQFRIYAVVLPRDYRRLHLAIEITVDTTLKALVTPTGALVDNASANKTELNNLFADFKDQLSDAESKIDLAQQTWPLLTPDSYNNDRTTYTANLKNLTTYEQTAHNDLHKAAADLHKISQDLKLV